MNKVACRLIHRETHSVGDSRQLIAQANVRMATSQACLHQSTASLDSSLTAVVETSAALRVSPASAIPNWTRHDGCQRRQPAAVPPEIERRALNLVIEAATGSLWDQISPATLEIIVGAVAADLQRDAQLSEEIERSMVPGELPCALATDL